MSNINSLLCLRERLQACRLYLPSWRTTTVKTTNISYHFATHTNAIFIVINSSLTNSNTNRMINHNKYIFRTLLSMWKWHFVPDQAVKLGFRERKLDLHNHRLHELCIKHAKNSLLALNRLHQGLNYSLQNQHKLNQRSTFVQRDHPAALQHADILPGRLLTRRIGVVFLFIFSKS